MNDVESIITWGVKNPEGPQHVVVDLVAYDDGDKFAVTLGHVQAEIDGDAENDMRVVGVLQGIEGVGVMEVLTVLSIIAEGTVVAADPAAVGILRMLGIVLPDGDEDAPAAESK